MSHDTYILNIPDVICGFLLGLELNGLKEIKMVSFYLGFQLYNYSHV